MEKRYREVLDKIEVDELVELTISLGKIPSPRGHETEAGEYVFSWLKDNGFLPFKQRVTGDRFNVVGTLKGESSGPSLIFNSHLDTAFLLPEDKWILGEAESVYYTAYRDEDAIYGHGVVNDKGPMAAFLMAAKALKNSRVQLKGDVLLTAVIGEIGTGTVDEFQDPAAQGKGIGTRHLVTNGVVANAAVVAEATGFSITWVEAGVVFFKITVKGMGGIYTPYIRRPYKPEENPNALVRMSKVILALEEWALDYERNNTVEFEAGTMIPKVNVGAIRGGLPNRPTVTPGVCSIYVDVRLPPGKDPLAVKSELRNLMREIGINADIQTFLYRRGYEGKNVQPLIESVRKAHRFVFQTDFEKVAPPVMSMWRDVNIFNEMGIPAITYGPTAGAGGRVFSVRIDDLLKASQVYALTALNVCNQSKT